MLSEWDKNSAGNVALTPIVKMEAVAVFGQAVALRLELSQSPDRTHTDLRAVQIGMSPDQVQDMIHQLQWCLDHLQAPSSSSEMN